MDTRHLTLDVSKAPANRPIIRVGEGDVNGTALVVDVTNHGEPLQLDGYDVLLLVKFGEDEIYKIPGEADGSSAMFVVDAASMRPGVTDRACVQLSSGDDFILSTGRFVLEVLESAEVS